MAFRFGDEYNRRWVFTPAFAGCTGCFCGSSFNRQTRGLTSTTIKNNEMFLVFSDLYAPGKEVALYIVIK